MPKKFEQKKIGLAPPMIRQITARVKKGDYESFAHAVRALLRKALEAKDAAVRALLVKESPTPKATLRE